MCIVTIAQTISEFGVQIFKMDSMSYWNRGTVSVLKGFGASCQMEGRYQPRPSLPSKFWKSTRPSRDSHLPSLQNEWYTPVCLLSLVEAMESLLVFNSKLQFQLRLPCVGFACSPRAIRLPPTFPKTCTAVERVRITRMGKMSVYFSCSRISIGKRTTFSDGLSNSCTRGSFGLPGMAFYRHLDAASQLNASSPCLLPSKVGSAPRSDMTLGSGQWPSPLSSPPNESA